MDTIREESNRETLEDDLEFLDSADTWSFEGVPYIVAAEKDVDILYGWTTKEPKMKEDGSLEELDEVLLVGDQGEIFAATALVSEEQTDMALIYQGQITEGPMADMLELVQKAENGVAQYHFGSDILYAISMEHVKRDIQREFEGEDTVEVFVVDRMSAEVAFGIDF